MGRVFSASCLFARNLFYTEEGVDISDSDDCVRSAMKILFLFFDIPHVRLPSGLGLLLDAPVVAFSVCPRGSLLIPCTNSFVVLLALGRGFGWLVVGFNVFVLVLLAGFTPVYFHSA